MATYRLLCATGYSILDVGREVWLISCDYATGQKQDSQNQSPLNPTMYPSLTTGHSTQLQSHQEQGMSTHKLQKSPSSPLRDFSNPFTPRSTQYDKYTTFLERLWWATPSLLTCGMQRQSTVLVQNVRSGTNPSTMCCVGWARDQEGMALPPPSNKISCSAPFGEPVGAISSCHDVSLVCKHKTPINLVWIEHWPLVNFHFQVSQRTQGQYEVVATISKPGPLLE